MNSTMAPNERAAWSGREMARPVCISTPSAPRRSGQALLGRIAKAMRVERKVVVPVVCCTVLLGVVTTCFPLLVLPQQFERWEYHLGPLSYGSATVLFRHLYRGGPVLPLRLFFVSQGSGAPDPVRWARRGRAQSTDKPASSA